jgi:peptidoglycan/xylan/chitin deacetylase (PgdA/CDA1 family)
VALQSRPAWRWPNGSGLAVWIVPNIEVFDGTYPLEAGGRAGDTAGLASREYGNRVGVGRIRELLSRLGIRATAAVNGAVAQRYPDLLRQLVDDGWELMGHGHVNNRRLTTYPRDEERDVIASCLANLESVTGQRPRGWLSPGLQQTPDTLSHLVAEGVRYVADWINDDQPYVLPVDGGADILSIPYSVETNDKSAYDRHRLAPDQFAALIKRQFDYLYAESRRTALVFPLAIHPYLSGVPHRMGALEDALRHICFRDGVWVATGNEIADAYLRGAYI